MRRFPALLLAWMLWSTGLQAQTRVERMTWVENTLFPTVQIADSIYLAASIEDRMEHYHIHGLSLAIIYNYKLHWARAYGYADTATRRKVTATTLFQAGSISKSLNALGVLKLADEGRLDLQQDINAYLKSWTFPEDSFTREQKINTAHLLSHSAGLSVHGFPGYRPGRSLPTVAQILDGQQPANTRAVRSLFAPGQKIKYSGGGTTITQQMVEDLTGRPYEEFMRQEVLKPLRMKRSSFRQPVSPGAWTDRATGYKADGTAVPGRFHIYPEMAAAGLWTHPSDLAKFIIDLQKTVKGRRGKVLSQPMAQRMVTSFVDAEAGLGVFLREAGGKHFFSHGGADEGFRALYFGSLDEGFGAVVMVNSDNVAILPEVMNSITIAYGWPSLYPVTKHRTVQLVPEALHQLTGRYTFTDGDEAIISLKGGVPYFQLRGRPVDRMYFTDSCAFFCLNYPFGFSFASSHGQGYDQLHIRAGDLYVGRKEPDTGFSIQKD